MSYLVSIPESGNQKIYKLEFGVNKIGRNPNNNVQIMDSNMSRYHAEIKVTKDKTIIKDCNSKNRTFVNGIQIIQALLKEGDLVSFGNNLNFQFFTGAYPDETSVVCLDETSIAPPDETNQIVIKKLAARENTSVMNDLVSSKKADYSIIKLSDWDCARRSLQKLKILLEVSQKLCSPQNPDEMLSKILELLFKIMDIDRAVILLIDRESQELKPQAIKLRDGVKDNQKFYSTKITELVRQTGDSILSSDATTDERFNDAMSIINTSIHASICVPLIANNQTIGVLYVDNLFLTSIYCDEDVDFLIGLANQAAAAINLANEFEQREKKLQQQIRTLQITIDQNKKEREVAEITTSDYFKDLQEKAKKLRKHQENRIFKGSVAKSSSLKSLTN